MKLKHLSDIVLNKEILMLVNQEREVLSKILWHLFEIDRRKMYADHRCGSLFEYCVKVLKYSEGQASRRVNATRLLREVPEISKEIESGEINLTQINQTNAFFKDENIFVPEKKIEILGLIKGKTTRETDAILSGLKKEEPPKTVTMTIKQETHDALQRLKGLRAHVCADMDGLLMSMHDEVLSLWSPNASNRSRGNNPFKRYLSRALREEVWKRDEAKCTNCGSTYALQFDHITPFAKGGKSVKENIQLLCRNCNQRKGDQRFFTRSTSNFR